MEGASVALARDRDAVFAPELEGERVLPCSIEPGASLKLWTRAKPLAARLDGAGHGGRPRLLFRVRDADGGEHELRFRLRVREYLELRDE